MTAIFPILNFQLKLEMYAVTRWFEIVDIVILRLFQERNCKNFQYLLRKVENFQVSIFICFDGKKAGYRWCWMIEIG